MAHVFISYARHDAGVVSELIEWCHRADIETWVDTGRLEGGAHWRQEIDLAIKNAAALVVVASEHARQSEYVTYEWSFAMGLGIPVIPVLTGTTTLHPKLEELQRIVLDGQADWHAVIVALSSRVDVTIATIRSLKEAALASPTVSQRREALETLGDLEHSAALDAIRPGAQPRCRTSVNWPPACLRSARTPEVGGYCWGCCCQHRRRTSGAASPSSCATCRPRRRWCGSSSECSEQPNAPSPCAWASSSPMRMPS